jgi:plastocyanin
LGVFAAPVIAADIPHENPDEANSDNDLESVERWLGGRMEEIHVDCAEGIEVGEFDACEDLDEEYTDLLDRYATVENDRQSETETAQRFNETRTQQREYAALREEFERTLEEYETARAAGNDAEARALARELQRLNRQIETLGGELEVNFVALGNTTGSDLSPAAESINSSTNEVETVVVEVESETFEAAEINATVSSTASFAEPGTVSGRVTTTNGTGIADSDIVLTDGSQMFTTTTAANGSYELLYRPSRTRVGATNQTVQYQPSRNSSYLGAEANGTIIVQSTDSDLQIERHTERAAFGDRLTVTGQVRASGRPAPDVDVTLADGTALRTTTRTDSNGSGRPPSRVEPRFPTRVFQRLYDLDNRE